MHFTRFNASRGFCVRFVFHCLFFASASMVFQYVAKKQSEAIENLQVLRFASVYLESSLSEWMKLLKSIVIFIVPNGSLNTNNYPIELIRKVFSQHKSVAVSPQTDIV